MPSTYLQKSAFGSANQKTYTISFWAKLSTSATGNVLAFVTGSNYVRLFFENGALKIKSVINSSTVFEVKTNALYRDPSAWYHFVIAMDTTQATDSNRIKFYVNGVQETSLAQSTYPSQNFDTDSNNDLKIGYNGTDNYFDGLLSHFHYIDGTAYDASAFGSTDSTTGEWKINTSPSVTYGSGGFLILKDGNTITDQSTNSNDFSLGAGQITNLKDNPSHNFCNINTLFQQTTGEGVVVNNCGNTVYYASNASRSCFGSIAPSSGKYYFEAKVFGGTGTVVIGIVNMAWSGLNGAAGAYHDNALNFGYNVSGQTTSGGTNTAYGSAISDGDIVGVAMDLDNSKLYFSLNGVFQGSGVPTSGASGTNAAFTLASGANYTAACRLRNGTQVGFNFGNGQYSGSNLVTTNSGDGYSGAEGSSKFSYQPPTGYSAISTKGLNE